MKSAKVLDKKRAWKQVIEARQIINVLEDNTTAWINHPAIKMWQGHIDCLQYYYNIFLKECLERHNIKTTLPFICNYFTGPCIDGSMVYMTEEYPWWVGNEDFHRAMRARLIEKDRNFYLPLFPNDEGFNGGKYFWPVMENKTFRVI